MDNKIDIVVTWVDGSDPYWLNLKKQYSSKKNEDSSFVAASNRYQDNGLLRYLFRGIEKFMPWVNNIFFVTFGHLPKWLNVHNYKVKVIKHEDFIPKEYLPTFNSNTILLNLHRIKGLSEHFIFFNDDMFVIDYCKKTLFFKNNLPCDMAVMNPVVAPNLDPFWDMMLNNVMVVNNSFSKKNTIKKALLKWYTPRYGLKNIIRNASCSIYHYFPGFFETHIPNSYLKSAYEDFWNKNADICRATCLNKFRSENDITEWAIRYWQFAKNNFYPINKNKLGTYTSLKDTSSIDYFIRRSKKYKLVCFNDECDDKYLNKIKDFFDTILGDKSGYEND